MLKTYSFVACLFLALCFFILPAQADENEVWWASAKAEAEREGYKLIDCKALNKRIKAGEDMVIVDARADYEFVAGHIPGSINLEFDLGDKIDLPADKRAQFKELVGPDKKRTLVLYCRSFR